MPEHQDRSLKMKLELHGRQIQNSVLDVTKFYFLNEVGDNQHASRHQTNLLHNLLVKNFAQNSRTVSLIYTV